MSRTQDLCDGVVTLTTAVRSYEQAVRTPGADLDTAWAQVRRATGYMQTAAAWREQMNRDDVLRKGVAATVLGEQWDMDRDPWG